MTPVGLIAQALVPRSDLGALLMVGYLTIGLVMLYALAVGVLSWARDACLKALKPNRTRP